MLSNCPYSIICWHFLSCVRNAQIAMQVKNKIKQTSLGHFDWVTSAVSIFSVSWCSDTAFTWHYEYQPPALLLRLNSNVSRTARDLHVIPGVSESLPKQSSRHFLFLLYSKELQVACTVLHRARHHLSCTLCHEDAGIFLKVLQIHSIKNNNTRI